MKSKTSKPIQEGARGVACSVYYFKNKGETLFASRNPYWKLSCVSRRTCLHGTHTVRLDFTVIT